MLLQRILACREKGAYLLHEFVVMPNHFHMLMTPGQETSLEKAVQLIKGGFSHTFHKERGDRMEIWQVGFHD
jgi:putative transposase